MLLPGLRAFLAVAEAGSMREAAGRLRLAQSAVSRRIQLMEEELGAALLERGARGVALTPAGEILLRHAREASQQAERLLADLDALRGVRRGHVMVRTVESFAASTLPRVLGRFRSAYPAVTLDVTVAGSDAILAAVRDRLCHVGIAFNPPADPDVEVLASVAEPLAVAVGPGHSLARAKRASLPSSPNCRWLRRRDWVAAGCCSTPRAERPMWQFARRLRRTRHMSLPLFWPMIRALLSYPLAFSRHRLLQDG
jgi:DNA-binding transcriptional LysR family regulator